MNELGRKAGEIQEYEETYDDLDEYDSLGIGV